jgi:hypothetical protein
MILNRPTSSQKPSLKSYPALAVRRQRKKALLDDTEKGQ